MTVNPTDNRGEHADTARPFERMAHNVASIAAIPWEELPDGPARFCLLEMAYMGANVGAFRTADGCWWVRVESRAETCAAWAARFSV